MKLTFGLLAATFLVFLLQLALPWFTGAFALTPAVLAGQPWTLLTYMFLHATQTSTGELFLMHIFFNMLALGIFGPAVEQALGGARYLALYLLAGLGSAFLHIALAGSPEVLLLGASGAVFGVLAAYGYLYPRSLIFIPPGIPVPAFLAVFLFAGLELFLGFTGLQPGIANFGHLGGIATGFLFMFLTRRSLPRNLAPAWPWEA